MKKAYVKVKNNSVKSILKRPYIAATIIGASLCAIVLSLSVPTDTDRNEQEMKLPVTTEAPQPEADEAVFAVPSEETVEAEKAAEKPKQEVVTPNKTEVTAPSESEISSPGQSEISAEEGAVSVGLFSKAAEVAMVQPVDSEIQKGYSGEQPVKSKTMGDWRVHSGIDLKAEQGQQVVAAADGEVVRAEQNALTGYTVSIDHGNGILSTVYNLESTEKVVVGQRVKKGDVIGAAGNSAATELLDDPHIHFEVKVNGEYVNPEDFLK